MNELWIVLQVAVAFGIYNVWLLRRDRPSPWRGRGARNLEEEFRVYGLPAWAMTAVGALKLVFATLLLVGVWVPGVTRPAALGLAALMLGAVAMHVKVRDPLRRSLPALSLLVLCLVIVLP